MPERPPLVRSPGAARAREPWRDDRLGRELREALAPLRAAQPPDDGWTRLAARIAADEPLGDRLPAQARRVVALVLGEGALRMPARDARLRATGLLAATAMVAISIASFGVIRGAGAGPLPGTWPAPQPLAGLTVYEAAIQPSLHPRPVARALPGDGAAESLVRTLRGVRAWRAQELLERSARSLGVPRRCLEAYRGRFARPAEDIGCRAEPSPGPVPAWVAPAEPPQSL